MAGKLGVLDFSWPHPHVAAGGAHVPMHVAPHGVDTRAEFARAESSRSEIENDRLLDAVDVEVTAAARIKYAGPYRATTAWYGPTLHVRAMAYAADDSATLHLVAHGASVYIPLARPSPVNVAW